MGKVGIPADGAKHTNIFLPRLGLCEEIKLKLDTNLGLM